jgi:SAM-dependent MidA family methyltransferase
LAYSSLIELALYHPDHGFYSSGGVAGRRGDFLTSPEVGPLFGHVVANALDAEWDRLGQPQPFTVVDYGAGPGTLARTVLAAKPRSLAAMRYIAVERSAAQHSQHPESVLSSDGFSRDLIEGELVGVVIANELLDNLAFTPVIRVGGKLQMLDVALEGDELVTVPSVLEHDVEALFDSSVHRAVLQPEAASWLEGIRNVLVSGRIIVVDYARFRSNDVEIRTYAEHGRAGDPLEGLGTKDITADVDLEQLQRIVGDADHISTQADWLALHGIDALVDEGRQLWESGASAGDLASLRGRSRIREAEALTDPAGLGGFRVAEWSVQ